MSGIISAITDQIDPARGSGTSTSTGTTASSTAVPSTIGTSGISSIPVSSDIPSSSPFAGFGGFAASGAGGLASSPNVPAPGTSLDPATGLPHTAGLTRAELDARKASAIGGAQSSGLMGGLGTSSNVPTPGSSINPDTGFPHTAGLTRTELETIKAKGQGLLDPAPSGSAIKRESAIRQNFNTTDLSGREQAAAQLVGGGLAAPASPTVRKGSIVEDIEKTATRLGQRAYEAVPVAVKDMFAEPKGKGVEGSPVKPRRGSAAALFENVRNSATKITTDIANTVQNAVIYDPEAPHSTLPAASNPGPVSGLKDASVPPATNISLREEVANPNRRGSIIDTVTQQAKKLTADVQHAMESGKYDVTRSTSNTTGTTMKPAHEGGLISDIKGFISEAFQAPGDSPENTVRAAPAQRYAFGTVPIALPKSTGASPATAHSATLPSQENQGARPGEVTGGIGALPGKLEEAGVAVPPEVRASEGSAGGLIATSSAPATTASTSTPASHDTGNAGLAGLAVAGGGAGAMVASLLTNNHTDNTSSGLKDHSVTQNTSTETTGPSVASLLTKDHTDLSTSGQTNHPPVDHSIGSSTVPTSTATQTTDNTISKGSYGLAAPLPATNLGLGAAHGATDLEATPGVNAAAVSDVAPTPAAHSSAIADTEHLSAPRGVDRTASLASVTAIRHGTAGDRTTEKEVPVSAPSPLATVPSHDDESGSGQKSTTRGTGPNHTTSLSPGGVNGGVGHPDTRDQEGTSRTPGNYPGPVTSNEKKDHSTTTSSSTEGISAKPVVPTATSSAVASSTPTKSSLTPPTSASSPARKSIEADHKRTGSSGSTGKKVGFMQKLKGEVKVISGKLSKDEKKIELGEKIKHGEA